MDRGDARRRAGRGGQRPLLPGGRGPRRAGWLRRPAHPRRGAGGRAHPGRGRGSLGAADRRHAARRAAGGGGPSWLPRRLSRSPGGQLPGAAAVSAARVHRDRRPARLLPAVRHRRPGDAAQCQPRGATPRNPPIALRASRRARTRRRAGRAGRCPVSGPLVLGIETSCDETGAGLVRGHDLLADAVASSVDEHARFGGVVPEVASRAHLEAMVPAVDRALATAGAKLADVDAIAVTAGPGLAGALLVGVCAAKAYSLALGKPLYGVNHLAAHIAVDQLEHGPLPLPSVALLVSGGHSSLLLVSDLPGKIVPLGATIDDAAGEAYDKVARLLGLPFPGGPP